MTFGLEGRRESTHVCTVFSRNVCPSVALMAFSASSFVAYSINAYPCAIQLRPESPQSP